MQWQDNDEDSKTFSISETEQPTAKPVPIKISHLQALLKVATQPKENKSKHTPVTLTKSRDKYRIACFEIHLESNIDKLRPRDQFREFMEAGRRVHH